MDSVPGTMSSTATAGTGNTWDTLDEPIWTTIHRDVVNIGTKLRFVLMPMATTVDATGGCDVRRILCKNWDLWGPFLFTAYISLAVNICNRRDCVGHHESNFSSIFVLLWIGTLILSLNYQLLLKRSRGNNLATIPPGPETNGPKLDLEPTAAAAAAATGYPMSLFQLLCLFGYCLAIPSLGIFVVKMSTLILSTTGWIFLYLKFISIILFGFAYPVASCSRMLSSGGNIPAEKRFLVLYPIFLYFLSICLYIYTFV